jgi:hypothetical protein
MSTNEHASESDARNEVSVVLPDGQKPGCCGKCSGGADCEAGEAKVHMASARESEKTEGSAEPKKNVVAVVSMDSIGGRGRKSRGGKHDGTAREPAPTREPNVEGLLDSARSGDFKAVRDYAKQCDASLRDASGRDALMLAAMSGSLECVEFLAKTCDPKLADLNGDTALMHAARAANKKCVLVLLDISNALRRNHAGETAWSIAIAKGLVNEVQRTGVLPARTHVIVKKAKPGKKASEIAADGQSEPKSGEEMLGAGENAQIAEAPIGSELSDMGGSKADNVENVEVSGVDGDGI